ncbi:MAG TPA: hypothetical protein VMT44_01365 [Methanoregula sp.]|nr:hypothetical protein [Methanoregula sp.]
MTLTKAAEILGVDTVWFVEPSFAELNGPVFNTILADYEADEGRLLIDEAQEPLALALHGADGWVAGTFLFRSPSSNLIGLFEETSGEILQEDRAVWTSAVRDYFSRKLMAEVPPSVEDLNPARRGILRELIAGTWEKGAGEHCIDCCCGSGVGSLVLRDLGYAPLSFDNDEGLLARGLAEGRLHPEETMWIDATVASRYLGQVPKGIAIMAGEINDFSAEMWERILGELFEMTREAIVTVGTEKEALLVRQWGTARGRTVGIRENPADPIYDRWVCVLGTG